jgi:hypothetical protein
LILLRRWANQDPETLTAQTTPRKERVQVICLNSDGDTVGSRVCTALRDRIASSPRYTLTNSDKDSTWGVHIASVSVEDGVTSSLSYTLTLFTNPLEEMFIASGAQFCGSTKIDSCAAALMSEMDGRIVEIAHRK